jgi:uncharacterized secreted protein with C-terminal beta-propeller domain
MSRRLVFCAVLALAVPLAGCTADDEPPSAPPVPSVPSTDGGAMRLVAFSSCAELIADLRKAAKAAVGPYGLPGNLQMPPTFRGEGARTAMGGEATAEAADSGFSRTNVHEQGADEPDVIKTDGRRIVTVREGTLWVIDPVTRRQTGKVDLGVRGGGELKLLLTGDSALVLVPEEYDRRFVADSPGTATVAAGSQVLLVDLTGTPKVVSRYRGDGSLVDARLTGSTARIVLRNPARIQFPRPFREPEPQRQTAANRKAIEEAPESAWLPRWEVTDGSRVSTGRLDCDRVSRPTDYSGGSMVSILTFDLTRPSLGNGDPVAVVADGDTVYGTADSLYLANDDQWRFEASFGRMATPQNSKTELFKFTFTGNQRPTYRASGTVPGNLLNQYAMSAWDGHLRVATTNPAKDRSAVRVFAERDGKLVQTGIVDGLGKGEQIYSVRFVGARGYVVTFKQTDPLYSLDLSDPAKPAVTGELKITGYSAHLQPVGEDRMIGIGQEADRNGMTKGTQISLFDVSDPANPKRLAQYHRPGAYSDAEYNPHAVLWWPATQLLVVPVSDEDTVGALALRVTDKITLDNQLGHPADAPIMRSLVVGGDLWTLSYDGLQAASLSTMDRLGWVPLKA